MVRRALVAVVVAAAFAWASVARGETTVAMRPAAEVAPGAPVLVRDVAEVCGDEAERLGAVVVLTSQQVGERSVAGRVSIDLAAVRAALDRAGANWGRTVLSGGTVAVRIADTPAERPREAAQARRPAAPQPASSEHQTVDFGGEPTVRTHIAARLAHLFSVSPEDLRLKFRAEDEDLLATRTRGRRVDVQPAASAASGRIPVRVYIYAGDRIVLTGGATVEAMVRREVLTATGPIERGEIITPQRVAPGTRWMSPAERPPLTLDALAGQIEAKSRIAAGEVLTADAVQAPIAARRGDLVTVHCLSGGITVRLRARAQGDVRDGDVGEFRAEGAKKTFLARMDGPGRAVMVTSAEAAGAER